MPEEPDPPRKVYGFKPREFVRDNRPTSEIGPAPTVKDLAKIATEGSPALTPAAPRGPRADDPNDVYAILQANRAAEQDSGGDQLKAANAFRYRRKRDYWLMLLPTEAVLGTVAFLGRHNPAICFAALVAMGLIFVILTWIMWQVMDRY